MVENRNYEFRVDKTFLKNLNVFSEQKPGFL